MAQRTQGKVDLFRDHPNLETAANLIEIRVAGSARHEGDIAELYRARGGSEQEANAEFLKLAWNSHDTLVAALRLIALSPGQTGAVARKALADAGIYSIDARAGQVWRTANGHRVTIINGQDPEIIYTDYTDGIVGDRRGILFDLSGVERGNPYGDRLIEVILP